ncbi:MAG: glycogen/starch/alpha-glucan family phosphorylase [Oscillospiraceae bacterium]|nr:glycogen/starch/alpha-glucan family phosphorylase [Oscillospiraceae bacterium]
MDALQQDKDGEIKFVERRKNPDRRRYDRRGADRRDGGVNDAGVAAGIDETVGAAAAGNASVGAAATETVTVSAASTDATGFDTAKRVRLVYSINEAGGQALPNTNATEATNATETASSVATDIAVAPDAAVASDVAYFVAPEPEPSPLRGAVDINAAGEADGQDGLIDTPEKRQILRKISEKLSHNYGRTLSNATPKQVYNAVALTVRDSIMEKWTESRIEAKRTRRKQLYYLSLEFLVGRALNNNIINLLKTDQYRDVLTYLGRKLDDITEIENDAGLGNGGLGRLAACFMDSLSTLKLNASGCGILYEYGLFKQRIMDGYQIELPDPWLEDGNIWEIKYPDDQDDEPYEVHFGGTVSEEWSDGSIRQSYDHYETVMASPHDIPILGYDSQVVNRLRLWSARSPKHLDMDLFNSGDYHSASRDKNLAEALSKVLYPEDNHYTGKTLRLRQQYFFVSATIQWIVRDYKLIHGTNFFKMADHIAIHINDTHPALAIPELMRILIDEEKLNWADAWDITSSIFSYTNHTIMSEALECWPVAFFEQNLPRIYKIVSEINETYCKNLWDAYPGEWDRIADMAVIANDEVRMANLCIVMCKNVNGVSELHTDILRYNVFRNYNIHTPEKFINITNGVTHRRWLLHANPGLSALISGAIGDGWIMAPERLSELGRFADDASFVAEFMKIKLQNKRRLSDYILKTLDESVDPKSIFDVQVKRLHEYKRQLLNIIHILHLYRKLKENPSALVSPRTFIFGAKASPGYYRAKLIIKLITSVAEHIKNDPDPRVREMIKVVFIENYGVSIAEKIIPAADVSEQISTAGKEASGTGNMKMMLNGALTLGTMDGANVEIRRLVGDENIYIFGLNANETHKLYVEGNYSSRLLYEADRDMAEAVDMFIDGALQPDKPRMFSDIYNALLFNESGLSDEFLVFRDFDAYAEVQQRLENDFVHSAQWGAKAIKNVAAAGHFSSDRTIGEYNKYIWQLD